MITRIASIKVAGSNQPKFEDVFQSLRELKGIIYHMQLKFDAQRTVKPARWIAVALQDRVQAELQKMESDRVIAKVTEPTSWSSHMVVAKKEKVRICLYPSYLNKAILRKDYHMPTLEDVVPRLLGARYFSTLDASSGFWKVKLYEGSSWICTMSTPYGRYRFLRMPFGIASIRSRSLPTSHAQSSRGSS